MDKVVQIRSDDTAWMNLGHLADVVISGGWRRVDEHHLTGKDTPILKAGPRGHLTLRVRVTSASDLTAADAVLEKCDCERHVHIRFANLGDSQEGIWEYGIGCILISRLHWQPFTFVCQEIGDEPSECRRVQ